MRPTRWVIFTLSFPGWFHGEARAQQSLPADDEGNGTITIDFPGGTLESYVKALSAMSAESNVVLTPGTEGIPLPPFSLKGVPLQSAVELINFMAHEGRPGPRALPRTLFPARPGDLPRRQRSPLPPGPVRPPRRPGARRRPRLPHPVTGAY